MNGMRCLAVCLLSAAAAQAGDWPQWLGPKRDGTSEEKVAAWTDAPTAVWSAPVGEGHSSPVVADGRVYLHVKPDGRDAEEVLCFDAKTGKQLWKQAYGRGPFSTPFGNGPRGTPTVDGGQVFTLGSTGILSCFDAKTGDRAWQVDTLKKFGATNLRFGISASPLVYDRKVYVNVGAKGASVVAFDRATGDVVWKAGDDAASYSSPVIWADDKQPQAVFLTGAHLTGLDPKTGDEFWKVPFKDLLNESSTTPVRVGDLLVGSSVTAGSIGLKMAAGEEPSAEQLWKKAKLTCYFSTPVVAGEGHLYMVTGKLLPPPSATLHCVKADTGEIVWSKEGVGKYHASLLKIADGKMLLLEDDGELALLDGGTESYKELARSKVCGNTWAHPALADGVLFLRDEKELKALKLSAE